MRSITLKSPAKINLFLKVVRRLPDGYHELVTLFHRVSLFDTIRMTKKKKGISLYCREKTLPLGETNLIVKAYRMLEKEFPNLGGVKVTLAKRIPVGAGLGGGSSNAATFLLGMKRFYHLNLTQKRLMQIGRVLGADVPFFISGVNQAVGRDRGDRIQKAPVNRMWWFLLLVSNQRLMTRNVYQNLPARLPRVSLTKVNRTVKLICNFLGGGDCLPKRVPLLNDLEPTAFHLRPSLAGTIERIKGWGAQRVMMSGSGPTIFAVFKNRREAELLAKKVQQTYPQKRVFICHTT